MPPLSKKPELQTVAQNLADDLRFNEWMIDYDGVRCHWSSLPSSGRDRHLAVHHRGLRHPRDHAVTIRERDTMAQSASLLTRWPITWPPASARSAPACP